MKSLLRRTPTPKLPCSRPSTNTESSIPPSKVLWSGKTMSLLDQSSLVMLGRHSCPSVRSCLLSRWRFSKPRTSKSTLKLSRLDRWFFNLSTTSSPNLQLNTLKLLLRTFNSVAKSILRMIKRRFSNFNRLISRFATNLRADLLLNPRNYS